MSENCHVINHPVVQHKLTELRDKNTTSISFRLILSELTALMTYEATKELLTKEVDIETPMEKTKSPALAENVTIISILRAGLGMQEGALKILPFANAGHIGIYRDKFINNTVEYYFKIPTNSTQNRILLCDPMIATGDTIIAACDRLKQYEVGPITILSLLASPQAVERMQQRHPEVKIFTCSIEKGLTDKGYLLPGLGDCGDRLYGTL